MGPYTLTVTLRALTVSAHSRGPYTSNLNPKLFFSTPYIRRTYALKRKPISPTAGKYYTVFDADHSRLGFALARAESAEPDTIVLMQALWDLPESTKTYVFFRVGT